MLLKITIVIFILKSTLNEQKALFLVNNDFSFVLHNRKWNRQLLVPSLIIKPKRAEMLCYFEAEIL